MKMRIEFARRPNSIRLAVPMARLRNRGDDVAPRPFRIGIKYLPPRRRLLEIYVLVIVMWPQRLKRLGRPLRNYGMLSGESIVRRRDEQANHKLGPGHAHPPTSGVSFTKLTVVSGRIVNFS